MTLADMSEMKLVKIKKVNLSKRSILFASILLSVVPQLVSVECDDSQEWEGCLVVACSGYACGSR